jgi:hypothetical protein
VPKRLPTPVSAEAFDHENERRMRSIERRRVVDVERCLVDQADLGPAFLQAG